MKELYSNKKNILAAAVVLTVVVTAVYFLNCAYGNQFAKADEEKNIKAYIVDTYEITDFILTDVEYDSAFEEYCATVTFSDSEDKVFEVAYSVKESRITDNYESTVANGLNTFVRLSSEYGKRVMDVISDHYDGSVMCYGELGKNQTLSQQLLEPDKDFDMYNLPLEATVSVFMEREDTSSQQFAQDLAQLQMLMYANEIAVDYYDIMYNSSILLEDFPSVAVVENLENTDALAEYIEQFMQ